MPSKRVPLSLAEKTTIATMVQQNCTDKEIAEYLKRSVIVISNYRRNNIGKKDKQRFKRGGPRFADNGDRVGFLDKKVVEETKLKTSGRYRRLQQELTNDQLVRFVEEWANYETQFEDMTPIEEADLETLIHLNIRISNNNKSMKEALTYEEGLKKQFGGTELDMEDEAHRAIHELIIANNSLLIELNKEYKLLNDQREKIKESLNATRQQRESRKKIGAKTLLDLFKEVSEKDTRVDLARETELARAAMNKKKKDFERPHTFADGTVEPIIMDGGKHSYEEGDNNGN